MSNQEDDISEIFGIKESKYDYIAITDADNTYPNQRILEFFDYAHHVILNLKKWSR